MSRTKFKSGILEFYNTHLIITNDIDNTNSVAWSNKEAQETRFETLYGIGITKDDTVLDLGCGLGHLTDFIEERGYDLSKYTGLDINKRYVEICEERKPGVRFVCGEIFDLNESFDYVIGSGVFTVLMSKNEVLEAISHAFDTCKKGVAFNFLTKEFINEYWVNSFKPNEFYSELSAIYPKIKLVTDYYGNEDFTVYIYK
jgi:SAM-dependent methyltransferase